MKRLVLHKEAVPSQFSWTASVDTERSSRSERRNELLPVEIHSDEELIDVAGEEEVYDTLAESLNPFCEVTSNMVIAVDSCTQTDSELHFSASKFRYDHKGMLFYTGLDNYDKFKYVLHTLGSAAYHLQYIWRKCETLSIENQFFLTLVRLRTNKTIFELSRLFDISEFSVSNIFITWINFMAVQWKELNMWPSRDLVRYFMPDGFKVTFPKTRVIIDGMECPVVKPKSPIAQQATFSTYKNRNTLKVLVGCSPSGVVSLVSPAYGGSTSDRQCVERSSLNLLCNSGDEIMADKGFNVQDLFITSNIIVNMPTFLKKGNRFNNTTLVRDRKIASKRVHIERVIGLAKTYKILCQPMDLTKTALGSEIIFICCMLCNFRQCIIPKTA